MRHCWKTWVSCWNPRPRATRCGRCGGSRRATRNWRRGCAQWGTRSARAPSRSCAGEVAAIPLRQSESHDAGKRPQPRPGPHSSRTHAINSATIAMQAAGKPVILNRHEEERANPDPTGTPAADYRPKGCLRPGQGARLCRRRRLGKVVPYGVYDIAANAGCVKAWGIDNDTAQFSGQLRSAAG